MRENREPGQTSGEEYKLAKKAANRGTRESFSPMLHYISREPCNQGIRQKKSAGGTEHLRDSSRADGTENRQAHRTFRQVKRECGKPAPAAQQQANQQHPEVLHCQWHRCKREGDSNACA